VAVLDSLTCDPPKVCDELRVEMRSIAKCARPRNEARRSGSLFHRLLSVATTRCQLDAFYSTKFHLEAIVNVLDGRYGKGEC